MTDQEKSELKLKLKKEIKKTQSAILQYEDSTKPIKPENSLGRISRLDAINNKSVIEAALREASGKLKNLKVMLRGIDNENFGHCRKCQNPIPIPRLMYRPESRFCVKCAR